MPFNIDPSITAVEMGEIYITMVMSPENKHKKAAIEISPLRPFIKVT
jgi:hypothetical protein|tara:strand:- start:797 stop:937 length:141 start_codon:yes stop_codon:yes gene_type:complete